MPDFLLLVVQKIVKYALLVSEDQYFHTGSTVIVYECTCIYAFDICIFITDLSLMACFHVHVFSA